MFYVLMLTSLLADAPVVAQTVEPSARLVASELRVGEEYDIVVNLAIPEDLEIPAGERMKHLPMLQIDVPPSVELSGKVLSTHQELARNEFLMEPYERLITKDVSHVKFKVVKKPEASETIGLVVTAFLSSIDGNRSFFLRRRLALPLKPNAVAGTALAENSQWGIDKELLNIGDSAPGFSLPRVNGSGNVTIGSFLGKKNIIVTTYRASW
jgi:hypothetical protein